MKRGGKPILKEFQDQNTSGNRLSTLNATTDCYRIFTRTIFVKAFHRQRLTNSLIAFLFFIALFGRESWVSLWSFRSYL